MERSYADRADGATNFDPEMQFDKDIEKRDLIISMHNELVAALEEMSLHFENASSGFISGCMSDEVWCKKQDELIAEARVLILKSASAK